MRAAWSDMDGAFKVNEEQAGGPDKAGGEAKKVDFMEQHMQRWEQRVQIIVAVAAAFLIFTIWFMLHE
jgi:hypothetical protein